MPQQFLLQWNEHMSNLESAFNLMRHENRLSDVTLCVGGQNIQAHKVVLSANSVYFENLFTTNPCQHPIMFFKDVQYEDMLAIVEFMYNGVVYLNPKQLSDVIKIGVNLQIRGISGISIMDLETNLNSHTQGESTAEMDLATHNSAVNTSSAFAPSMPTPSRHDSDHQMVPQSLSSATTAVQSHHVSLDSANQCSESLDCIAVSAVTAANVDATSGVAVNSRYQTSGTAGERLFQADESLLEDHQFSSAQCDVSKSFLKRRSHQQNEKHGSFYDTERQQCKRGRHSNNNKRSEKQTTPTSGIDVTSHSVTDMGLAVPTTPTLSTHEQSRLVGGHVQGEGGDEVRLECQRPVSIQQPSLLMSPTSTESVTAASTCVERHLAVQHQQQQQVLTFLSVPDRHSIQLVKSPGSQRTEEIQSDSCLARSCPTPSIDSYICASPLSVTARDTSTSNVLLAVSDGSILADTINNNGSNSCANTANCANTVNVSPHAVSSSSPGADMSVRVYAQCAPLPADTHHVAVPQTAASVIDAPIHAHSHTPVMRDGPAVSCSHCWNTEYSQGRTIRRKTKYMCRDCSASLCIVPCFQEYHEALEKMTVSFANESTRGVCSTQSVSSRVYVTKRLLPKVETEHQSM